MDLKVSKNLAKQRGVSLVEILVTVVVTSIGLLGVAGLHAVSLRNNSESLVRTQANLLARDILDRMRANLKMAQDPTNPYEITAAATITSTSTSPLAVKDLAAWKARIASELQNGTGAIDCSLVGTITDCNSTSPGKVFKITITWTERTSSGDQTSTYETQVEI